MATRHYKTAKVASVDIWFCLNVFDIQICVIQCIGNVDLIAPDLTFFYLQLKFSFTCLFLNEAHDLFVMLYICKLIF